MSTFPQSFKSSVSHWQATNRGTNSLWSLNKEAPLSKDEQNADIVIVGAGMTGSALAYFLTRPGGEGEGKRVVVVEAKDVGSGATGRNGGHVGPATFTSWANLQLPITEGGAGITREEATKVIQAERDNLEIIAGVIEEEGIAVEVDFWRGHLCETHQTADRSSSAKVNFKEWLKAREELGFDPDSHDSTFIYDVEEAKKVSRLKHLYSCYLRPAGSVHSHKLCTSLLRLALASSPTLSFHSWTPVSSITQSASEKGGWVVQTSKGSIKTRRVVLATNAHTKNFFSPEEDLHHHIVPTLAQCSLITPPTTFSSSAALKHTMNLKDGMYLVQTPGGGIVLGGGFERLVDAGILQNSQRDGVVDDSSVIPEWEAFLASYCKEYFEGWGEEALGEGLSKCWTGILTHVKDVLPVVGEIEGKRGMWVAAGFHGHGMSRIFSTTSALAQFLKTDTYSSDLLPESFKVTPERLARARDVGIVHIDEEKGAILREKIEIDSHAEETERKERVKKKKWDCVIA